MIQFSSKAPGHLLLITALAGVGFFLNANSAERPLRALDRDLFSLLRANYPDLLRGFDLRPPAWLPRIALSAVDLSGEDLRLLRFADSGLRDVRLQGSHLQHAEFECVGMTNVDLTGAHLQDARLDYSKCEDLGVEMDKDKPKGTDVGKGEDKESDKNRANGLGKPKDKGQHKEIILEMTLAGADLSRAEIIGPSLDNPANDGTGTNGKKDCGDDRLIIRGNLNGARFSEATLKCVSLQNVQSPGADLNSGSSPSRMSLSAWVGRRAPWLSLSQSQGAQPNLNLQALAGRQPLPQYAGLGFDKSSITALKLTRGDFSFSDFYQASLNLLEIDPSDQSFGFQFSTLQSLNCKHSEGGGGCSLQLKRKSSDINAPEISLNVMNSPIVSNLPLPKTVGGWPALLCDQATQWTVNGSGKKATCNSNKSPGPFLTSP